MTIQQNEAIHKDLREMCNELYCEGYQCGIHHNLWYDAWALAFLEVAHGKKYDSDMVARHWRFLSASKL